MKRRTCQLMTESNSMKPARKMMFKGVIGVRKASSPVASKMLIRQKLKRGVLMIMLMMTYKITMYVYNEQDACMHACMHAYVYVCAYE